VVVKRYQGHGRGPHREALAREKKGPVAGRAKLRAKPYLNSR
jgi:hypothetical protein